MCTNGKRFHFAQCQELHGIHLDEEKATDGSVYTSQVDAVADGSWVCGAEIVRRLVRSPGSRSSDIGQANEEVVKSFL